MEKKNNIFNAKDFEEGFNIWTFDREYYNYNETYRIVNESLKKYGMRSYYTYLVETLNEWRANKTQAQYLWIDCTTQEFGKVYGYDLYDAYLDKFYQKEMQDRDFALDAYMHIESKLPKWQFEKFADLRKDHKDAYHPDEFKQAKANFLEQMLLNGEFGKSVFIQPLNPQWAGSKNELERER